MSAQMNDLDWTRAEIEGAVEGIEASRLIGMAGLVLPVSGTLHGGFELRPAATVQELSGEAWLHSRQLSIRGLPLDITDARALVDDGRVRLGSSGSVADGRFSIHSEGSIPELIR